jgi:8-oxo-dGTP pyrophosphatase MutT (NUDIX family)
MKFCSDCGSAVSRRVPDGDDRERMVCTSCERVHYVNPLVVVGCVVEQAGKVLLCRRAIEPGYGKWTIPAGFLELGETMSEGARRETWEEAGAQVEILAPHSQLELTHIGQLHATFRARMISDVATPGIESLECALFEPNAIPWQDMAFPAGVFALRLLLQDRGNAQANCHHGQLRWTGDGSRFDPNNYSIHGHVKMPMVQTAGDPNCY